MRQNRLTPEEIVKAVVLFAVLVICIILYAHADQIGARI